MSDVLYRIHARQLRWPAELQTVLKWYRPELQRLHEDAPDRGADLSQLLQIAAAYSSREQFLTDLTLDPPSVTSAHADSPSREEDYVTLSTIHSAKGQEWRSVQILSCVDGCTPSDLATGSTAKIRRGAALAVRG